MNDEQITKKLFSIGEADVKAGEHRTALRAALMREHARIRRPYFSLTTITKYITMKTALIPISTFAVIAFVMIGTLGVTNNTAQAQELVQRSMARAVQIPAEMRAALEAQMKTDMMDALKEAYAAPDLRILTREEYEKEAQFTMATGTPRFAVGTVHAMAKLDGEAPLGSPQTISFRAVDSRDFSTDSGDVVFSEAAVATPAAGSIAITSAMDSNMPTLSSEDVVFTKAATIAAESGATYTAGTMVGMAGQGFNQPVKYLRYTSPDGRKVTLGLDDTDTPVFRIEELTATDVVKGPNGEISIQGKVLKMINIHTANFDGGYGSAGAVRVEGTPVQWEAEEGTLEVVNE